MVTISEDSSSIIEEKPSFREGNNKMFVKAPSSTEKIVIQTYSKESEQALKVINDIHTVFDRLLYRSTKMQE